jgi:hypothetical protein
VLGSNLIINHGVRPPVSLSSAQGMVRARSGHGAAGTGARERGTLDSPTAPAWGPVPVRPPGYAGDGALAVSDEKYWFLACKNGIVVQS